MLERDGRTTNPPCTCDHGKEADEANRTGSGQLPACPGPSRETISFFPRYQHAVSSLPPTERNKLIRISAWIRNSFRAGCVAVRTVRIVGHADKDLQRGTAFEYRISLERARATERALKKLIGNRAILSRIAWEKRGAGATSLSLPNPRTETERARNRRVDIELATGASPQSANRPIRILDRFDVRKAQLKPLHAPSIRHAAQHVVASWRHGTPIRTIHLVGHTDNTGQQPFNATLGNSRAAAVQAMLSATIDALWPRLSSRIRFVRETLGGMQPVSGNQTSGGRARNRRVEIFFPDLQPLVRSQPKMSSRVLASEFVIGAPRAASPPKIVVLPGIMGSVLRDPTVPDAGKSGRGSTAAFCRSTVIPSASFRRFELAITALVNPLLLPGILAALEHAMCQFDMHVIWGTWDMIPWLFIQDQWCKRLVDGDGQLTGGSVIPAGLESLVGSYDLLLRQLAPVADVLPLSYDWRLSNSISAHNLEQAILAKWWPSLRDGELERILADERVTIVAHSMGGLVARNLIESPHRKGPFLVKQLITAGTPHDGAPETYSHFNRKSLPFGFSIFNAFVNPSVIAGVLAASVPALAPVISSLPKKHIPYLMGADLQLELVRSFAGVIQLLPNSPFAAIAGRPREALSASYARMEHLRGAGRPVIEVMDLLRADLFGGTGGSAAPPGRGLADLNSFLSAPIPGAAKPVTYHTLASTGKDTVTSFEVRNPPSWARERLSTCARGRMGADFRSGLPQLAGAGDGTVPLASAQVLPAGSNIIRPAPRLNVEHGKLFKDLEIRRYCFRQLGLTGPAREMDQELLELELLDRPGYAYAFRPQPELAAMMEL